MGKFDFKTSFYLLVDHVHMYTWHYVLCAHIVNAKHFIRFRFYWHSPNHRREISVIAFASAPNLAMTTLQAFGTHPVLHWLSLSLSLAEERKILRATWYNFWCDFGVNFGDFLFFWYYFCLVLVIFSWFGGLFWGWLQCHFECLWYFFFSKNANLEFILSFSRHNGFVGVALMPKSKRGEGRYKPI